MKAARQRRRRCRRLPGDGGGVVNSLGMEEGTETKVGPTMLSGELSYPFNEVGIQAPGLTLHCQPVL